MPSRSSIAAVLIAQFRDWRVCGRDDEGIQPLSHDRFPYRVVISICDGDETGTQN